jgi:tetratricopeptide (TPR) repeat protein
MNNDQPIRKTVGVRALPGGYLVGAFAGSFVAALVVYLDYQQAGLIMALVCWLGMAVLWITDRIEFDGRRIRRTGLVPRMIARATATRDRLKLSDIEQVETSVFPGIKRGRNVYYTYRTAVSGKGVRFVFSSGHSGYRPLIRKFLPLVADDALDNVSLDLRDYMVDVAELRRRVKESEIPSSEVLEGSVNDIRVPTHYANKEQSQDREREERATVLRRLANELRVSGRLFQALEAFRRAVILKPSDARLLFEFAACLRLIAGSENDSKLEHKALAMMRLAERHGRDDGDLLARIGESYYQIGEWRRAAIVFKRAGGAVGDSYRSLRGMAELSLREGKLAHVIHNFAAAHGKAATTSLRRWTQVEVDYFTHLNSDEEYMELEISRVNLLDSLGRTKRAAIRICLVGMLVIPLGIWIEDDLVANIGWAVSGVSLVVWIVMIVMIRMLSPRIPFELVETDD